MISREPTVAAIAQPAFLGFLGLELALPTKENVAADAAAAWILQETAVMVFSKKRSAAASAQP